MPQIQQSIKNNPTAIARLYAAMEKARAEETDNKADIRRQENFAECDFDRDTFNTIFEG